MAAAVARYGSTNNVTLTFTSDGKGGGGGGNNGFRPTGNQHQAMPGSSNDNMFNRPGYRFKSNNRAAEELMMGDGPGRRLRKNVANVRRHVDYIATILNHHQARLWQLNRRQRLCQQPDVLYQNCPLPPISTRDTPVDCILTKYVRAAMNKVKCPVYTLVWTPEGKRLITGASTGEFTLWNGTAFNFETILQAHDSAIRAMTWSYNEQWLVSGDHDGFIKYWQPNMNNVHMYQAHKDEPIRGLSFAPTDIKLVSASDDGTARIWDFARCTEERALKGHGSEVRCVKWHPTKGLVVTGSRDSQQPVKMWDPKSGQCLATLQDHKSSVLAVEWNKNGHWLLTASRDHLIKLYDIRMMKEMRTFRGHKKEVTAVAWHPIHEGLFVSGGGDGSLAYWLVDNEKEVGLLEHAHDQAVWALEFHPLGHVLASGSNDNNTKFWARNRPGDTQEDIFGLVSFAVVAALDKESKSAASQAMAAVHAAQQAKEDEEKKDGVYIPGMGLDEDVVEKMNTEVAVSASTQMNPLTLLPEDLNARRDLAGIGAKRTLIKQPPAKKAQRQFERMWNVSKPSGGEDGHYGGGGMEEDEMPRRTKGSLLGPPPSIPMPSMLSNPIRIPPSALPPPSMPPPIISPGGRLQWPPNMAPPILPPPHIMSGPPPPRIYPQKDESWKTPRPSEDIDLRQMGRPPSQTGDIDMRQNTQWNNGAPSPTFNNDPRIRTGGNEITEDVRDPRRRNQGGNQSQGNQMVNPWGNEQPPMQFNVPPPMGNPSQMGGPPGGMRGGMRGGRGGGQNSPFRGNRGGPPRGRGGRGRGGPY
ncbi:hypothetical protein PRIPAC_89791 [Pristionchus pacificus]|uniref:Translation initiation factor eIF2A n=1 Tax=Pristionchus pacificus TaxID=54126 RepID=A0A2A6B709_PRIPA|nr:hypothetical protein PRIPAC_89791 [Pristionchus pacificus]|eukprot:PDM61665.1 translation initiation factor eIF2A [Pristionchus pacificus]